MHDFYELNLTDAARQMLRTLREQGSVTLDISSADGEARELLALVDELHARAVNDHLRIALIPLNDTGIRLIFHSPTEEET